MQKKRLRQVNISDLATITSIDSDALSEKLFIAEDVGDLFYINKQGMPIKLIDGSVESSSFGFIDYNDTGNKVTLPANTWVDIPNDGQGAFSNDTYKPTNITQLLDTSNGRLDVSELSLGDDIFIRNDYTVTPKVNDSKLEIRYVLGSGAGQYSLEKEVATLNRGAGVPYRYSLATDYIYIGDNNTRQNPIVPQLKLEFGGTFVNAGSVVRAATK